MKDIRSIIYALLFLGALLLIIPSCSDDDDTSYAFQEISAPSDITANFEIAQDDSGMVTVTPSGTGASTFQIHWGDSGSTVEEVAPGGSADHTYAEGEYEVRIIAVGSTGLTSEWNQPLNISFRAPENLQVIVLPDPVNPAMITVAMSADHATLFHVLYGDVMDEEPSSIMVGSTAEHLYPGPGEYEMSVTAIGAGAATAKFSTTLVISDATDPIVLPIDFESFTINYAFGDFGNAFGAVVDNPVSGGINESIKVGLLTKAEGSEVWAGSLLQLMDPMDFEANKLVKMKVYSPKSGVTVKFKVENADNGDISHEIDVLTTTMNEWEELEFDFSDINTGNAYHKVVVFFDFGNAGDGSVYYFDDISLVSAISCESELTENIDPANGDIQWTFLTSDVAHLFEPFGNISSSIVPNPVVDAVNSSCQVQQYFKNAGCETWSGVGKGLVTSIDLSSTDNTVFTMKVLAVDHTTEVTLRLEFEPFPNVDPAVDIVQTISGIGQWEELVFDFSAHKDKTFKSIIVYFDRNMPCDDATYYFDDVLQVAGSGVGGGSAISIQDFEAEAPVFTVFGNIPDVTVIPNPDASGINTSPQVAQLTKSGGSEVWAGSYFEIDTPLNLSDNPTIRVKTWTPKVGAVIKVKIENLDASITHEVDLNSTVANSWEELSYDFSDAAPADYMRIVIFFDFGNAGDDSVYYYDDLSLSQ
ncbi:MAG: hypothetical protein ACI9FN_000178 [Saprospiraceae bacterium]|jgi:hypothetical protein